MALYLGFRLSSPTALALAGSLFAPAVYSFTILTCLSIIWPVKRSMAT